MNPKIQNLIAITSGVTFMALAILYSVNNQRQLDKLNKEYFELFNESFEGRITSVINEYGVHTCMVFIDLNKSTTELYDIRTIQDDYYAVIKNKKAEVIERIIYEAEEKTNAIRENDYFIFDGKKDSAYLYRDNYMIDKWKPSLNDFDFFGSEDNLKSEHKIEQ